MIDCDDDDDGDDDDDDDDDGDDDNDDDDDVLDCGGGSGYDGQVVLRGELAVYLLGKGVQFFFLFTPSVFFWVKGSLFI